MPDVPRELLIVLESRPASETLAQLRAVANVTQVFPPRLALVQAGPDARTRIAQVQGVLQVLDDPARKLPADLTPAAPAATANQSSQGASPPSAHDFLVDDHGSLALGWATSP